MLLEALEQPCLFTKEINKSNFTNVYKSVNEENPRIWRVEGDYEL
jgi:putative IMPACT (imprinted ancient) family translation regulator